MAYALFKNGVIRKVTVAKARELAEKGKIVAWHRSRTLLMKWALKYPEEPEDPAYRIKQNLKRIFGY